MKSPNSGRNCPPCVVMVTVVPALTVHVPPIAMEVSLPFDVAAAVLGVEPAAQLKAGKVGELRLEPEGVAVAAGGAGVATRGKLVHPSEAVALSSRIHPPVSV